MLAARTADPDLHAFEQDMADDLDLSMKPFLNELTRLPSPATGATAPTLRTIGPRRPSGSFVAGCACEAREVNLLLLEAGELDHDGRAVLTGRRATICAVPRSGRNTLRAGVVDGEPGEAVVEQITPARPSSACA